MSRLELRQVPRLQRRQRVGVVGLGLLQDARHRRRHRAGRGAPDPTAPSPSSAAGRRGRPTTTCRSARSCRAPRSRTAAAAADSSWATTYSGRRYTMELAIGTMSVSPSSTSDPCWSSSVMSFDTVAVGRDLGVGVGRTGRPLRDLVEVELAVVPRVGQPDHPGRQVEVLVESRERGLRRRDEAVRDREDLLGLARCRAGSTPGTAAPCGPAWSRPAGPGCCRCSAPAGPATAGRRRRSARAARRCWRRRRPTGWSGGSARKWRTEWRRCPAGSGGAPAASAGIFDSGTNMFGKAAEYACRIGSFGSAS